MLQRERDVIRQFLGIDKLIKNQERLERHMSKASDKLDAVTAKVDDLVADFTAFRDAQTAAQDDFSPEVQAAYDRLAARVDELDSEVGDGDGSDSPVVDTPVADEPVPAQTPDGGAGTSTDDGTTSFR